VTVGRGKQAVCLSEEQVHGLIRQDIEDMERLLKPAGILLDYSDIRIANWCESCRARNLTPGRMVADHLARSVRDIRAVNPALKILVWSDMFDPYQNAGDHYHLVNGSLAGSWQGLPPDAVIVNSNQTPKYAESLKWFAARQHSQILSVCFDNAVRPGKKRLENVKGVAGLTGFMYMTTGNHYEELEPFANQIWGMTGLREGNSLSAAKGFRP